MTSSHFMLDVLDYGVPARCRYWRCVGAAYAANLVVVASAGAAVWMAMRLYQKREGKLILDLTSQPSHYHFMLQTLPSVVVAMLVGGISALLSYWMRKHGFSWTSVMLVNAPNVLIIFLFLMYLGVCAGIAFP